MSDQQITRGRIKLKAFEIAEKSGMSVEQTRKVIEEAVRAIPDSELKKFRAGHILIIA
jgi:hypothetical protein